MAEYDKLTIKIVANTSGAIETIGRLSSRLDDLEQQADKMDLGRLREIQGILEDIANIDFSKVSSSLYSVVKSLESLYAGTGAKAISQILPQQELGELSENVSESVEQVADKVENVTQKFKLAGRQAVEFYEHLQQFNEIKSLDNRTLFGDNYLGGERDFSYLSQIGEQIKPAINNFIEFDKTVNTLKTDISGADSTFEELGQAMSNIGLNGTQMESVLKTIGQEINTFNPRQIKQLEKEMKKLGYSSEQIKLTVSKLKKEVDKTTKSTRDGISKVAIKFKSLALYRVLRLALMKIQESLGEAIQSLAEYDSKFNESVSNITSAFSYLSRSLIAMLSPLLKLFSPLISMITVFLGDIANIFGSIFAGASGDDAFTSATESAENYLETLKKVKSVTLGIDELNVVGNDDKNSSDKWEEISTMFIGDFNKIVEKLTTEIRGILADISDIFKGEGFISLISNIVDLLSILIGDTSEAVNNSIKDLIGVVRELIELIAVIVGSLKPLLVIFTKINNIILNLINGLLSGIFKILASLLDTIANVLEPILTVAANILAFILEPLVLILNVIGDTLVIVLRGILTFFQYLGGLISNIIEFFVTGKWREEAFEAIDKGFREALADYERKFILTVDNFVRAILGAIDRIGQFFGQDWGLVNNYGSGWAGRDPLFEGMDVSGYQKQYSYNDSETNSTSPSGSNSGSTQVNVYIDSQEVASRVNQINENRGTNTLKRGTLTYAK